MATAAADAAGPDSGHGSTIATVETDTGRLVERRPLAYLVVWGARNERRVRAISANFRRDRDLHYSGLLIGGGVLFT